MYDKLIIRPDRNIDYPQICHKPVKIKPAQDKVAEYTFPSLDAHELHHFEFGESSCKEYVHNQVAAFFKTRVTLDSNRKIVIGVSGGGDSNTLIESFLGTGLVKANQILAVMMLGIPDWDLGRERAEAICRENKVPLRFVPPLEVNALLGRKGSADWLNDFENIFPDADLEVLGTLTIRLSLLHVAKEIGAQSVVTGLNLEDILAECFLSVIQGKLPLPFPVRNIDGVPLWFTLYKIPKKILDGCHPKYSLENYMDRYPSKMIGRAIPYYVAQMMHAVVPGAEFDFLSGFEELSRSNKSYAYFDPDLGFSTLGLISKELKAKWQLYTQL